MLKDLDIEVCRNFAIEAIDFSDQKERFFFESARKYESFEDSWFAVIQGIRHNPRIFLRKIYFSDHPIKNETVVVFNHLCKNYKELAILLNALLQRLDKKEAVWKNVDPLYISLLEKYGFNLYARNDGWANNARFDDQTFPQYICSVKDVSLLAGACFSQLRQQVRAVEKSQNQIEIIPYKKKYALECSMIGRKIARNISETQGLNPRDIINANLIYLNYPPPFSYVAKSNGKIISFIAFDVRESIANFNCLIYGREIKYLSTYTMVHAIKTLYTQGVKWVNLSGSESQALDRWKKKFSPKKIIFRTHMVWKYKLNHEFKC